jgi:hypothetical protein
MWFVRVMGTELGPMEPSKLIEMARSGQLAPDDVVRKGSSGEWVQAFSVKGLFTTNSVRVARVPDEPVQMETRAVSTESSNLVPAKAPKMADGKQSRPLSNLDRIKAQLKALKFGTLFVGSEVSYLAKVIRDEEDIRAAIHAFYNLKKWIVVATNRRILLLDKGVVFGVTFKEIQISQVGHISCDAGLLMADLRLDASAGEIVLKNVAKFEATKFAHVVSDLIAESKKPPTSHEAKASPGTDVVSQLERLAELHHKGVLTADEFLTQKAKLLAL